MGKRVLVVEDCHPLADRVALLVESLGHQARIACDGPAALVVADHFHPELVLLHHTVPDMDGCPVVTALGRLLGPHVGIIPIAGTEEPSQLAAQALVERMDGRRL